MKALLQPTLVRRVVLALLAAFFVVWLVLLGFEYWRAVERESGGKGLRDLVDGLAAELRPIEDAAEARAIVAATANQINHNYVVNRVPCRMLMQLRDASGATLFLSPEAGGQALQATGPGVSESRIDGRLYRAVGGASGRWSVVVAVQRPADLWLLGVLGRDLTLDMLIAFPFVLLPLWFAVAQGLRPLRRLSERIAARGSDDLAPLGLDPKYRELAPLVGALDGLLGRLRGKVEREHAFVQDAAHELRTPMAVISAQAHVLAMARTAAEREEAERRLDQAIARASHLVEQLLQLARASGERAQPMAPVDVAQLVRLALAERAPEAIARDIDLGLDAPDVLTRALDRHALQSILHNLLGNAMRYVPAGGQVRVELGAAAEELSLSVADDGPGIAEAERALVFERFYRGAGQDVAGSGLGLAIVRQAAAQLGGGVELQTGLAGRGCRFVVRLPGR